MGENKDLLVVGKPARIQILVWPAWSDQPASCPVASKPNCKLADAWCPEPRAHNIYNRLMFIVLAAAAALAAPTRSPANDICLAMVPPRLAAIIEREQPDYVLPQLIDAHADRLMSIAASGDWPCPFVAIADFDGDGNLDRAILLKHKSEPSIRLIAARNVDGMWRIELQKDWPIALDAAVVQPLEAGLYEQTKSGRNVAAQLDNLVSIQSDHAGFLAGQSAGAKAAFFYQNNAWQQIWVDD
jgi:hypothetical protein